MIGPADAYEEAFDFVPYDADPLKTIMIASIPRSGSTYFCSRLWQTGVFGSPLEYFNFTGVKRMRRRFPTEDMNAYYKAVAFRRTSPNGVFSYKLFIPDLISASETHADLLPLIIPSHVIYLTRKDIVAHAVSYAVASQTGAWFHTMKEACVPTYSKIQIDDHVRSIRSQTRDWENVFNMTDTQPFVISYEDFLENEELIIKSVGDYTGISSLSNNEVRVPLPKKQSTAQSEQWIKRYKEDTPKMKFIY